MSDSCKEKAHGFSRSSHHFCYTATRWGWTPEHKKALKVSLPNWLHLHLIIPTPGSDLLQSGANWGRREVACVRQINTLQRCFSLSAFLWRRLQFQCTVPGLVSASSSSLFFFPRPCLHQSRWGVNSHQCERSSQTGTPSDWLYRSG